jgi:ubiquitin C-terminal hydrolase
MFLTIPVTKHLHNSLDKFAENDDLDSNNMYRCDACKQLSTATKKMIIHEMPNILIIHLKRFNRLQKINDSMEIPFFYTDANGQKYELFSTVNHYGGKDGGHYTANLKGNDNWFMMNDASCRIIGSKDVVTQNAYILFFRKI